MLQDSSFVFLSSAASLKIAISSCVKDFSVPDVRSEQIINAVARFFVKNIGKFYSGISLKRTPLEP